MTQHDIAARAPTYVVCLLSFIGLVSMLVFISHAPVQDAADDDTARAHVEQQAKGERK
jgi:hypothetical protein